MSKLRLRRTLPWTLQHASKIWDCYRFKRNICKSLGGFIAEIDSVKLSDLHPTSVQSKIHLSMLPHVVIKYGWIFYDRSDLEWGIQQAEQYEAVLQSGNYSGSPYGTPYERSTYSKVDQRFIGRQVIKVSVTFSIEFQKIYRREKDLFAMLLPENSHSKPIPLAVSFGNIFCPEWDNNHPDVLRWLKQTWQPAAEMELEFGINPLFDPFVF